MSTIVIISSPSDPHLPYVTRHLGSEHKIIIIDPVDIIRDASLDYHFSDGSVKVSYRGQTLSDVKAVWYRRPSPIQIETSAVGKDLVSYAASATERHILALNYMFSRALWVSDFHAIRRAGVKPLQLQLAHEIGLAVPDTVFASSSSTAYAFLKKHQNCIIKPQATQFPEGKAIYAKLITARDKLQLDGLRYDPYIFQQYIEPQIEYRVTVIGQKVFSASISMDRSRTERTFRDYRKAYGDSSLRIVAASLPHDIEQACIKLVRRYGLQYSAIDLIEDSKGKIWFLEINPNGQWAFIEYKTGQPLGLALAELLKGAKEPATQ